MNSKQLATVLIKILGVSLCIHEVPGILGALIALAQFHEQHDNYWVYGLSSFILLAIGLFMVFRTRRVVECLFRNEEI